VDDRKEQDHTMHNDQMTTTRSPRRGLGRARAATAFAVTAVLGTAGLAAIAASPAGATHKVTQHKTLTPAQKLAAAERTLQGFINAAPSGVTLNEAGSSLFYPLWQEWQHPSSPLPNSPVKLNPAAGGSGKGISEAVAGTIQIGASDAFLASAQRTGPPAMLNIPVVVSAQAITYNIPGLAASKHVRLSATIINDIYNGSITNWDNKRIKSLNPGISFPNLTIVPIRRLDSSGDTFIFTSYMWYGDKTSWNHPGPYYGPQLSYAAWPSVSGELAESGNSNMVTGLNAHPGGIAYVGVSYLSSVNADGLGVAALQNGTGNFELPDAATISNEIASFSHFPTTGAINLVYSKVKAARFGYPIVNFEYAIVQQKQPNSTQEAAIKAELAWGMDPKGGAQTGFLNPIDFKAMPLNGILGAISLLKLMTSS